MNTSPESMAITKDEAALIREALVVYQHTQSGRTPVVAQARDMIVRLDCFIRPPVIPRKPQASGGVGLKGHGGP